MTTTKTLQKTNKKPLTQTVLRLENPYSEKHVLARAEEALKDFMPSNKDGISPSDPLFQGLAVNELKEACLLTRAVTIDHKAFVVAMYHQLSTEFGCKTPSQQLKAMTAALSYCRILKAQEQFNGMLNEEFLSSPKVGWINALNKELDRANRHFMACVQSLEQQNMSPITVSVKTNTANIAQQQIVSQGGNNDRQ